MSPHQYGTLKYIYHHEVHIEKDLRTLHMGTIGSLLKRNLIAHKGGLLFLTPKGIDKYEEYKNPRANFREHDAEVSEFVKELLHGHRLLIMRKAG